MRTYGKLWLAGDEWRLAAEPHVALWAKRCFPKLRRSAIGELAIADSDAVCRDLEWFAQRFALDINDLEHLQTRSAAHQEQLLTFDRIVSADYQPPDYELALPLRRYQRAAVELYLAKRHLLLADDVGLGKTATAIGSFCDKRTLPAVVVTLAHLPRQWQAEMTKFLPRLKTHVLKKGTPYELPPDTDVVILNYHKLTGWADVLARRAKSIVFDEVQELRRNGSGKYKAAKVIADAAEFTMGLSATPIYNYGGEIFNVLSAVSPGQLGTRTEFLIEWCEGYAGKERLRDPGAFGSYLREQHVMLRRTRAEAGRELPALQKIIQPVESDKAALADIGDSARQLAEIILARTDATNFDRMKAAGEFDMLMRQATGIAKAPHVAAFVELLIESGERVLLYGWHRAVYEIWKSRLAKYEPAFYTGTESTSRKQSERDRFVSGQTPLMVMSLRAGAGVDGLQHSCQTVVIGELDWSPGVHEQNLGRIHRDGQSEHVVAYFMLSDEGSDPIMAETLGIKRDQIEPLRDPSAKGIERLERDSDGIRRLAERYLNQKENHAPSNAER